MEEWKVIDFAPDYLISNLGRLKSLKYNKELIKSTPPNGKGYPSCNVRNGRNIVVRIHRLVAEFFIPKITGKDHVNHKNGIKTDNRVENLEWCTNQENSLHGHALGLYPSMKGRLPVGKDSPLSKRIVQLSTQGSIIKIWDSSQDIERETGINRSNVCSCCNGRISKDSRGIKYQKKMVAGYHWKWEKDIQTI